MEAPVYCTLQPQLAAPIKSQSVPLGPGTGAPGDPWRDRVPPPGRLVWPSQQSPTRLGAVSQGLPLRRCHDTRLQVGADSNFPFYLLVQGEAESLTGPQTSCQELLIRAEQRKELTRPPSLALPASELAGQSTQMESDRLKERSLQWAGRGGLGQPA